MTQQRQPGRRSSGPRYKWVVLSNTTVGVLLATTNATSLMIALPVIFRGIHLNPLVASNFPYLLWILMGYMLVMAAVVVTVGRIGDIFGRVRMYNLGFAWFTLGAILLSLVWSHGATGALELIILRMFQAIGGALLMANSAAIITDAFPAEQLGLALGTNMVAAILGSFLGIVVGGLLSQVGWRWVFLANVPIGVFGTIWAYLKLKEIGIRIPARIDWLGNIAFAGGLAMVLTGFTYAIKPYGHSLTGWGNPFVLEMIFGGLALLGAFLYIETKVEDPLFRLSLFRIRAFSAGNAAGFLGSVGRGGFQFMLMIWFQGIWLPEHGYAFTVTPLWAGIYMTPFMLGFVVSGPLSGRLSDRYGARPFATAGMLLSGAMYGLMIAVPGQLRLLALRRRDVHLRGRGRALRRAEHVVDHELGPGPAPGRRLGHARDARQLRACRSRWGSSSRCLIIGLNAQVPHAMFAGLTAHGVPAERRDDARQGAAARLPVRGLPRLQPVEELLGPKVLAHLGAAAGEAHHWPRLLPAADRPAVQARPRPHPRLRRRDERDRRCSPRRCGAASSFTIDDESRAQKARMHGHHHHRHEVEGDGEAAVVGKVPEPV